MEFVKAKTINSIEVGLQDIARVQAKTAIECLEDYRDQDHGDPLGFSMTAALDNEMPAYSSLHADWGLDFVGFDPRKNQDFCPKGYASNSEVSLNSHACLKVPPGFRSSPGKIPRISAEAATGVSCSSRDRAFDIEPITHRTGVVCILQRSAIPFPQPQSPSKAGWVHARIQGPDLSSAASEVWLPSLFLANAAAYTEQRLEGSYLAYINSTPGALSGIEFCRTYLAQQLDMKAFFSFHPIERDRTTQELLQGVSEDEYEAFLYYKQGSNAGAYWFLLNKALRAGNPSDEQVSVAKSLEGYLKKRPSYSGTAVRYTDLPKEIESQYQVGNIVREEAFLSTSYLPNWRWPGSSKFVIYGKSGRTISGNGDGEGEILFPPGTRFKVLSKKPFQSDYIPRTPPGFIYELQEVDENGDTMGGPKIDI
jgi:hypothetical protein